MMYRFLILVNVCMAFPFKCPETAHWSLRASGHCPDPFKYSCLKNDLINGYTENCTVFDFLQPGRRHILRGGLDADLCSLERYQPWPLNFYTNISTNCIFLKSTCNAEGQVVDTHGNKNKDSTCRCDYTQGFDFLIQPKNPCFCVPSEEDCSCYLKTCPESTFKLSPDYACMNSSMNISLAKCTPITRERAREDDKERQRKDNSLTAVSMNIYASIPIITVCIGLILAFSIYGIFKYFRKAHFIYQPPDSEVKEGQNVVLQYKLLNNRFPVYFFRDEEVIEESSHFIKKKYRFSWTLEILNVTSLDEGFYHLEVAGTKTKPACLKVKPMFKLALVNSTVLEGSETVFECETEDDSSTIEWFKNDAKLAETQENIIMETLSDNIYKLKIASTRLDDKGTYSIKKNGACSKAELNVKALFKQPLTDGAIMEGFQTILQCQTEEERSPVEWFHDDHRITDDTNNITMKSSPDNIYELIITPTSLKDKGTYKIKKNNVCSEAVLHVQAFYKQPLAYETCVEGLDTKLVCETEEDESPVLWFKNEEEITDNTNNIEIKSLPGQIHELIISPTSLEDEGTYKITKNNVCSEVVLHVTAMFKENLKNTTTIEGSRTILECKTEERNGVVEWFKNEVKITKKNEDNMKMEALIGCVYRLFIFETVIANGGNYKIKKNGICSEAVLDVKEMFIQKLASVNALEGSKAILYCETVEESGCVDWFRNGIIMTERSTNITMENKNWRFYKLIFEHANLQDRGTYRIRKNGIINTAVLSVTALFKRKLENATILEGSDILLECETEAVDSPVEWFKDGKPIRNGSAHLKIEILQQYIHRLFIKNTSLQDVGKYSIKTNSISSEAVLTVKAMFKRPLVNVTIMESLDTQLECETEEENSPVKWLKNGIELTDQSKNIKMESLPNHVYRLTITPTSINDAGMYRIEKKGFFSEAKLDVKEMPETIKQMSEHDKQEFLKAAKSGTTKRYYIRVMIVGEESVGKTCLLRRLMNEKIDDVTSTVGIDIERRKCQVEIDTGEWKITPGDEECFSVWSQSSNEFADCGFWDFAGQKEFYATHQAFLGRNAVYLLTTNITKDFIQKTVNDMIQTAFDKAGEYIDFWLDNIHCYCSDESTIHQSDKLDPPVFVICTGIDKYTNDEERDKRIDTFKKYLKNVLSAHEKGRHYRKAVFLSNKCSSDEKFESLRKDIFHTAKALPNWGDNLPTRWLVLEKQIFWKMTKKEFKSLVISYADVKDLAAECSFPDVMQNSSELDSFLKYEHDIGNIIFFEDVKSYIILDAKWLVEVFNCFVSHKEEVELLGMPEWSHLMDRGILSNTLIKKLLGKKRNLSATEQHDFVLKVMKKFDIIVSPNNDQAKNDIYMPCMMQAEPFNDVMKKFELQKKECKRSSWFCLEFDFLPPAYFNNILISFVKSELLCIESDERLSIYRNFGIFDIKFDGSQKLVICLSNNLIAMQVWQWRVHEDDCYSNYKNKLIELVDSIKHRYRMNIHYKRKFKCSVGIYNENKGGVEYDNVLENSENFCSVDNMMHPSDEVYRSWLTDEEIKKEYNKKGRSICRYGNCVYMSWYRCCECRQYLCKDCLGKHNNEIQNRIQKQTGKRRKRRMNPHHFMQSSSDCYILERYFSCNDSQSWIKDMKFLPTGKLVVVQKANKNQIMTYSMYEQNKPKHFITLKECPRRITVLNNDIVAILLDKYDKLAVYMFDIENESGIGDIISTNIPSNGFSPFTCIDNQFYIANNSEIVVLDKRGTEQTCIELGFQPFDICYDAASGHIFCVDRSSNQLFCIDREGKTVFSYSDQKMKAPCSLAIGNDRNVFVLCEESNNAFNVIKVHCDYKSCELVITDIKTNDFPFICFHDKTDSLVIGYHNNVYIYHEKNENYR